MNGKEAYKKLMKGAEELQLLSNDTKDIFLRIIKSNEANDGNWLQVDVFTWLYDRYNQVCIHDEDKICEFLNSHGYMI